MRTCKPFFLRSTSGQALVETALILPLLLLVILNSVNFGYFFVVALNVAAAPRSGVAYSTVGFSTPGGLTLPAAGPTTTDTSVSYLTLADITGALVSATSAKVQVCSKKIGLTNPGAANQVAQCTQYNSATATTPASDPESPSFVLHRVDIYYTFSPIIRGSVFNIAVLPLSICTAGGSCTFHRQVSMRALD